MDSTNLKEILASQLCRKTAGNLLEDFKKINEPWKICTEEGGLIQNFGEEASKIFKELTEIFDICSAKAMNIEDYDKGNMPFVTSTTLNNAVEVFIEPSESDKHFEAFNISMSSFGYANIQVEKFVARSHGAYKP